MVTGAAGFVASNLVDKLLSIGFHVVGIDNLRTGKISNLENALRNKLFRFIELDLMIEKSLLVEELKGIDEVYHLSANADVRFGPEDPYRDFNQNTLVTLNLLDAMRIANVNRVYFSSTGSIYGESNVFPTPETVSFPVQTSLYGASKLACEGLIQAFCNTYGISASIFRFVSVLGPRYSHGHVKDFFDQISFDPRSLTVLGNGFQSKSYVHVNDCVDGMILVSELQTTPLEIFNIGLNEVCTVRDSVGWIVDEMKAKPIVQYGESDRGWTGDNPIIQLDSSKLRKLGWEPKLTIEESVRATVQYLKVSNS
jgi:UDP-glucose 4-epimerase